MTLRVTAFTVQPHADGKMTCAVCGAKLRTGDRAESHLGDITWQQHAECPRPAENGASAADRLMADIRAGKPPLHPPAQLATRIQGERR